LQLPPAVHEHFVPEHVAGVPGDDEDEPQAKARVRSSRQTGARILMRRPPS
jgi:hypothetical protein